MARSLALPDARTHALTSIRASARWLTRTRERRLHVRYYNEDGSCEVDDDDTTRRSRTTDFLTRAVPTPRRPYLRFSLPLTLSPSRRSPCIAECRRENRLASVAASSRGERGMYCRLDGYRLLGSRNSRNTELRESERTRFTAGREI